MVEGSQHRRLGGEEGHRLLAIDPADAILALEGSEEVVETLGGRMGGQIVDQQRIEPRGGTAGRLGKARRGRGRGGGG